MASVQPYLMFNGKCEEAVKFYCDVFGGDIQFSQKFKDAPMESAPEMKERIMHTNFLIRGDQLMASDSDPKHPVQGNNVNLSVNYQKNETMDETFNKLSEGGKINMPLQNTFWGARFGMITDRYGINWMFNQNLN